MISQELRRSRDLVILEERVERSYHFRKNLIAVKPLHDFLAGGEDSELSPAVE